MIRARFVLILVLAVTFIGSVSTLAQEPAAGRPAPPAAGLAASAETITYQGLLRQGGAPASGVYDFQFSLYASETGGAALGSAQADDVTVAAGLFAVPLTFGEGLLTGEARWIELAVRDGAGSSYTVLSPRQRVTAAPLALALPGLWTRQNEVSPNLVGGFEGNLVDGAAVGVAISGGGADGSPNRAYDQYGVIAGGANNVAGQSGAVIDQSYAVVGGGRGNAAGQAYSTVGGGSNNIAAGQYATVGGGGGETAGTGNEALDNYATVGGGFNNTAGQSGDITGQPYATVGGGHTNVAGDDYATVGGGLQNTISATYGVIGGGQNNTITATVATIAGGQNNIAGGGASSIGGGANNITQNSYAAIGGGYDNRALSSYAAVGGGIRNQALGLGTFIGGGQGNRAAGTLTAILGGANNQTFGEAAAVLGGTGNVAAGAHSIAGGQGALAGHDGAFVWGGAQAAKGDTISSTGPGQFIVRAPGGMWLGAGTDVRIPEGALIATDSGAFLSKGGTWANASDRALKTNIAAVDGRAVLRQVAGMPISSWNYHSEGGVRHIGPMAQDFHAAFGLGSDDRHIATVDADGVALAAIQGLDSLAAEQSGRIAALEARLAELERGGAAGGTGSAATLALMAGVALAALGAGWRLGRRGRQGGAA